MTDNGDGSVSFEDVTNYSQVGDSFGAADINETNTAINGITISHFGTASASTYSYQMLTKDNYIYEIDGSKYMETTATLSSSTNTTVTFTNADILATSAIEVMAGRTSGDVSGSQNHFNYSSIYTTDGSCTITYPPFSENNLSITVRIYIK